MKSSSIDDVHGHSLVVAILFPTMFVGESIALAVVVGSVGDMAMLAKFVLLGRLAVGTAAAAPGVEAKQIVAVCCLEGILDMHPVGAYPHPLGVAVILDPFFSPAPIVVWQVSAFL